MIQGSEVNELLFVKEGEARTYCHARILPWTADDERLARSTESWTSDNQVLVHQQQPGKNHVVLAHRSYRDKFAPFFPPNALKEMLATQVLLQKQDEGVLHDHSFVQSRHPMPNLRLMLGLSCVESGQILGQEMLSGRPATCSVVAQTDMVRWLSCSWRA